VVPALVLVLQARFLLWHVLTRRFLWLRLAMLIGSAVLCLLALIVGTWGIAGIGGWNRLIWLSGNYRFDRDRFIWITDGFQLDIRWLLLLIALPTLALLWQMRLLALGERLLGLVRSAVA
jgi:hypothetical protein